MDIILSSATPLSENSSRDALVEQVLSSEIAGGYSQICWPGCDSRLCSIDPPECTCTNG